MSADVDDNLPADATYAEIAAACTSPEWDHAIEVLKDTLDLPNTDTPQAAGTRQENPNG
jgi:hypothetical protein